MPSLWHSLPALLLLPASISAFTFDCGQIRIDKQSFNLKKLGGPKTVHNVIWEKPSIENTTFTLDICNPLSKEKDLPKEDQCDTGTWICGREYDYHSGQSEGFIKRVIPIAGQYSASHGRNRNMDPKFSRLKDSATNSDEKEGVVVELHGGKYPNERDGTPQKAIIEFLCDKEVTGNEGFEDAASVIDATQFGSMQKRADDDDEGDDEPDLPNLDEGKQLKFVSYKKEGDNEVLRLSWRTKYGCEGIADNPDSDDDNDGAKKTAGWGFFTWSIIIIFLSAAAYIIFGSWLNYNRYGARGWDLIPHGDTIRDIPYIVKDWGSSMAGRLGGGGDRGGYSAV